MSHSLVEIPYSEWQKLCALYKEHKKFSCAYSLILNYINWRKTEPEINAKVYSLDGDWQGDGTFILIDSELSKVYMNTLSNNTERLKLALNSLDTNMTRTFFAIQERHMPILKQHLVQSGLNLDNILIDHTAWYYIEREKALEFDVAAPAGISLLSLEEKHAHTVYNVWPHRENDSIKFVKRLIKSNDSVGAFDKDGNLIAWCLRLPVGALGLVQVSETHKRQGLGGVVVRYMARLIAAKDEEVLAPVVLKNSASCSMFEKLGFKKIDNVYWAEPIKAKLAVQ